MARRRTREGNPWLGPQAQLPRRGRWRGRAGTDAAPVGFVALVLAVACGHAAPAPPAHPPRPAAESVEPLGDAGTDADLPPAWPAALSAELAPRGLPHAPPLALPPDEQGRERWLVFVGTKDVALGALHVARAHDGTVAIEPVVRWPAAVRVVGAAAHDGVAYVLLESLGALDQPAGLRAVWIDAAGRPSPLDASPMAFADVDSMEKLTARLNAPLPAAPSERSAAALVATLRAASLSTGALSRSVVSAGADVGVAWQGIFTQPVGRIDAASTGDGGAPSPLADRALALVRDALGTQACGFDACEAWSDGGRSVVRFEVDGGRWAIRALIEDAPSTPPPPATAAALSVPREVTPSADAERIAPILRARVRSVTQLLGQAPLRAGADTRPIADEDAIGAALADASDAPLVLTREGLAARVIGLDLPAVGARPDSSAPVVWEAAFADVDGDERTDVVLHVNGRRADGPSIAWSLAILAPPPSVQATALRPDLASALAVMDAADARSAAQAAVRPAAGVKRGVSREEACRVLAAAKTPAGWRRVAAPGARLLFFEEPGLPTWRPKIVLADKVAPDDVRRIDAHCAELACSAARPYCAWTGGTDSEHVWLTWQGDTLQIAGVAQYTGE